MRQMTNQTGRQKMTGTIIMEYEGKVGTINEDGEVILSGGIGFDVEVPFNGTNAIDIIDELCHYWKDTVGPSREDFEIRWSNGDCSTFVSDRLMRTINQEGA